MSKKKSLNIAGKKIKFPLRKGSEEERWYKEYLRERKRWAKARREGKVF